ncbi:MAG TPA: bacillithiol biosynthesis deacetylase BshB1 [Candidatus Dormibacteraeota bacterium]|nr:bacillithiol biosynthesis deacetylase BshB1 [Candidatus Dormibacteraeota bacterium]
MKIDLLVIAAHPDDAELTSGGTLLKAAAAGYQTGILDLTRGEMGTRGTPERRLREAASAARILGVRVRRNAGLPDAHLRVCDEYKAAIAQVIRELEPRTVILPYWEGRHPDHYVASTLGYEACFLAGLKNYDIPGQPFRPAKILYAAAYADVRPTFAVDITKYYERRRRAILAYSSQFRPSVREKRSRVPIPLDELEERMGLQARAYGYMIGVRYAEGYVVREVMQVEDVVNLPVRSV